MNCLSIYTYIYTTPYSRTHLHTFTHTSITAFMFECTFMQAHANEITQVCSVSLIKPTSCRICCQAASTHNLIKI